MNDLVERLLDAIGETEKIACVAAGTRTGSWEVEEFEPTHVDAVPASTWVDDGDEGIAAVNGSYRASHIAHNDPTAVQRRCAADRKIIDLYRVGLDALSVAEGTILAGACKVRLGAYEKAVKALAEGYGIEEDR
jgi:Family of unknown function (DUF6221)